MEGGTVATEMLASNVPEHNKRRSVMADMPKSKKDAKGGKFKKAFTDKFAAKYAAKDKK